MDIANHKEKISNKNTKDSLIEVNSLWISIATKVLILL